MVSWGGLGGLAPPESPLPMPCPPGGGLGGFAPQESPLITRALPPQRPCLAPNFFSSKFFRPNFFVQMFSGIFCQNFFAGIFFVRRPFVRRPSVVRPSSVRSSVRGAIFDRGAIFNDDPLAAVWAGMVDRIIWLRQGTGQAAHSLQHLWWDAHAQTFRQSFPVALTADSGTCAV